MRFFQNRRCRAFMLLLGLLPALAGRDASAGDASITTDPLAAALMPPPKMGASTFMPSFMRPPGRVFSFEVPHEIPTPDRYPTPGLTPGEAQDTTLVALTTPPSNSIFPRHAIIPFGWLAQEQDINPGDDPTKVQIPIRYEIYISRHDQWTTRLFVKERPTAKDYSYLFSPPGPGRYHWHVRAIYNRQMHGHNSEVRSFMVLP